MIISFPPLPVAAGRVNVATAVAAVPKNTYLSESKIVYAPVWVEVVPPPYVQLAFPDASEVKTLPAPAPVVIATVLVNVAAPAIVVAPPNRVVPFTSKVAVGDAVPIPTLPVEEIRILSLKYGADPDPVQIGRASCRERVSSPV